MDNQSFSKEEFNLIKEFFSKGEPLELIGARLNYRYNVKELAQIIKSSHLKRPKDSKIYCAFCYSEMGTGDIGQVTYTFYNHSYCRKCNILLERAQQQAVTETLIHLRTEGNKTKLEVNNYNPTKRCTRCQQLVPVDDFSWEVRHKSTHSHCKACRRKDIRGQRLERRP